MSSFIVYWSLTEGAALAVAQTKDSRPFAWGFEGVTDLGTACKTSNSTWPRRSVCLQPGHVHYCRLALMIEEHLDAGGTDFYTPYGANSWRAFYNQLLITLQDGEPQAAKFKIDVERLANDFCMSKEMTPRPSRCARAASWRARVRAAGGHMYVARQGARETSRRSSRMRSKSSGEDAIAGERVIDGR